MALVGQIEGPSGVQVALGGQFERPNAFPVAFGEGEHTLRTLDPRLREARGFEGSVAKRNKQHSTKGEALWLR